MLTISARRRDGKHKVITVWSPVAAGKTTVAVNLAAVMSEKIPTALVDLSSDNAVHTYLNCRKDGLRRLTEGDPGEACFPAGAPQLKVYTSEPGSKSVYSGEASVLNEIIRAIDGHSIVFDAPREHLKAANVLSLADMVVIVTDRNIHGTILLQKYLKSIPSAVFVSNRHTEGYPVATDPAEILQKEMVILPDDPKEILSCVLSGSPALKYRHTFQELLEKAVGKIGE